MDDPFEHAKQIRLERLEKARIPSFETLEQRRHAEEFAEVTVHAARVAHELNRRNIPIDTTVEITEDRFHRGWMSKLFKIGSTNGHEEVWQLGKKECYLPGAGKYPESNEITVYYPFYLSRPGVLFVAIAHNYHDRVRPITEANCFKRGDAPTTHEINISLGRYLGKFD